MSRYLDQSSLSELESEYELEMDNESEHGSDSEFEYADTEYESSGDYEYELDSEFERGGEYEEEYDGEYESQDSETSHYAERFYELAQREFESESELDQEVNGLLNEMEQDFFWNPAKRLFKKYAPGLLGKLGKFALSKLPAGHALKGLSALASGNLTGALKGLAKTALSSHPAIAAAMPALSALGFEASNSPDVNREAWDNYTEVAREAYENLAANITPRAANPAVASDIAKRALQSALSSARTRSGGRSPSTAGWRKPQGRRRVVALAPGEYLVVVRKKRR
ncbi:MAG: hypothetical protein HOP17_04140 [Acidobacteria bacterium]|nr:hypothetical protein [Acidobacteriota bacterium]